jgi:hypothetical protein
MPPRRLAWLTRGVTVGSLPVERGIEETANGTAEAGEGAGPRRREHFIPFRRSDIVALCAQELPAAQREPFETVARMVASLLHQRFHDRIEALKDAYHPFHTDPDTRTIRELTAQERVAAQRRVEAELTALATAANYVPMSLDEVEQALSGHSHLKLRLEVDKHDVDQVLLFKRGESPRTRTRRDWWRWRSREVPYVNVARVLVYAKFKEAEHFSPQELARLPFRPGSITVKLFRNVPREDLEMVFPSVKIRMRLVDKIFIGVPAVVSGIAVIATKLYTTIALILLLLAFWLGLSENRQQLDEAKLLAIFAGLVAAGGYVSRQVNNFKNRKISFMKALSENLYYRNLDNDAGVFHHLLDAAEEAEGIETVLAYHFLRVHGPLSPAELDARVEGWFAEHWSESVDFEVEDGVRKLREFGLLTENGDGRLGAVAPETAIATLDRLWDDVFTARG